MISRDKRVRRERNPVERSRGEGARCLQFKSLFLLYIVFSDCFVRIFSKLNFSIIISGAGLHIGYASSLLLTVSLVFNS